MLVIIVQAVNPAREMEDKISAQVFLVDLFFRILNFILALHLRLWCGLLKERNRLVDTDFYERVILF